MKNLKMSLNNQKLFVLLSFLSFFLAYPPDVAAQDKFSGQISSTEFQTEFQSETFKAFPQELSDEMNGKISVETKSKDFPLNHYLRAAISINQEREIKSEVAIHFETKSRKREFLIEVIETGADGERPANAFNLERSRDRELKINNQWRDDHLNRLERDFLFSVDATPASPPVSVRNIGEDVTNSQQQANGSPNNEEGFQWKSAFKQSLLFLGIQHGYAFTQAKTRRELKGNFFKDYIASVKSLHGWADGGRFFTNYVAHPMQGSFTGFIQVQNDPKGRKQQFGASGDYWRSRLKAMAWSAAWSTQFEIGPISQASIGNVGLKGKQTYVDLVITPTAGTAMLITEDAIDRFLIKRIERASDNYYLFVFSRMLLNPTRTVANLFRFKLPWYRDRPRER